MAAFTTGLYPSPVDKHCSPTGWITFEKGYSADLTGALLPGEFGGEIMTLLGDKMAWVSRAVSATVHTPVYENSIHPSVRPLVECDRPTQTRPTYTETVEIADTEYDVTVKPATEHWAIYFIDIFTPARSWESSHEFARFMRSHVPMFEGVDELENIVYVAIPEFIRAVARATARYYNENPPQPDVSYLQ
jgi:hypothetical protein